MKDRLTLTLAVLLAPAVVCEEPDDPTRYSGPREKLHIYILAGQSNMSGRAKVEEEDRQVPKNLFLLDASGQWVRATHPFIQYTNVPNTADSRVIKAAGKNGLNIGLAFARKMLEANPDIAIGLVVNSQGGSAIETWKKGASKSNYDKTLERVNAVRETGQIKGVLWHQGEANQKLGEKYLEPLAEVIGQFRKDLDSPKLPFVAGQLAPLSKGKETIEAFNRALLKLPERVPHTGVVRTEDLTGNDIHFNSAETRKLGQRYAEQMLKLQGK
jgi:Carbohydrate esterase, sialic acid-specific acetylesterase